MTYSRGKSKRGRVPNRLLFPFVLKKNPSTKIMTVRSSSGVNQIQQPSVLINQPMPFPSALGAVLGGSEGTGLMVHRLEMLPFTKLVLDLDMDFHFSPVLKQFQNHCSCIVSIVDMPLDQCPHLLATVFCIQLQVSNRSFLIPQNPHQ